MRLPDLVGSLRFRPHQNLNLKLLSLVLAIGLWSMVPSATAPTVVRGVPVRLRNIPAELALAQPFEAEIEVWVSGSSLRTRDLSPGELSPIIDMFGAFAGDNTITLTSSNIPTPLGVRVVSIDPARLRVVLEERVRAELPINAVVEGSPAEGFEIIDKVVEPATAAVTGPRSRVEALQDVSTETVSVAGRSEPLVREVAVVTDDPLVIVEGAGRVRLAIDIEETPVVSEVNGVVIELVNLRYRVDINPQQIGVVLRGPPSLLQQLVPGDLVAAIDVGGLAPRAEDYRIEPRVAFRDAELAARISILTLTPQRRIDVHVYDQPASQ